MTDVKQLIGLQVRGTPVLGHDPSCNSQPKLSMIPAGNLSKFCHTMLKQEEKFMRFNSRNESLLRQLPTRTCTC